MKNQFQERRAMFCFYIASGEVKPKTRSIISLGWKIQHMVPNGNRNQAPKTKDCV
jgi:hypothetical protein